MGKQRKYNAAQFESIGEVFVDNRGKKRKDTSANIYESMMHSPAFQSLNARQRMLYVYCKAQYYGKRKPERDFPDIEEMSGASCFYLNWAAVIKYGLYSKTDSSTFYKDMRVLCDRGLIEQIASGKVHHKKSVYKYSLKWRQYAG